MQKKPPSGVDDFAELVDKRNQYLFVDKSLLIKDFIDASAKVTLITRPRRWGKTLNLSMLEYFFAPTVLDITTNGLFDNLAISRVEGNYLQFQGKSPVIFISFKEIKCQHFENNLDEIKEILYDIYHRHEYLLDSQKLSKNTKKRFQNYLDGNVNQAQITTSLRFLSQCLYEHYQEKVYIFIDEYDTPLNYAYLNGYIEEMTALMKNLFGASLKGNRYLKKGMMTGILRISKNNMLSDLNNIQVFSVLNDKYAPYFGFTHEEVKQLFNEIALEPETPLICDYYNGYHIGNCKLYNPWSVIECLDNQGELKPYWVATANDDILKNSLLLSTPEIKAQIQKLISDNHHSVKAVVSENIGFDHLTTDENALWSLLLATGYLTQTHKKLIDLSWECELRIPNQEVNKLYIGIFRNWLLEKSGKSNFDHFMQNLVLGKIDEFSEKLAEYLIKYTSHHDLIHESHYHTFMTGLLCSLTDHYFLFSNAESGHGRADVILVPKDSRQCDAIIMEFKHDKHLQPSKAVAEKAVQQIDDKSYYQFITNYQEIKRILKMGLAFNGKRVAIAYRWDDLNGNPLSKLTTKLPLIEQN